MLKYGWLALASLFVFGAMFTLFGGSTGPRASTEVVLRGVDLRLYPSQDANAEWRFAADEVTFDPVTSQTEITEPTQGERYVRGASGELELDSTMSTRQLTIDADSSLVMTRATVYVPSQCATLTLTGSEREPVLVRQDVGFIAPQSRLRFPGAQATIENVEASFGLDVRRGKPNFSANIDSREQCVNGRIVTTPAPDPSANRSSSQR